jgi:hypothetical protein
VAARRLPVYLQLIIIIIIIIILTPAQQIFLAHPKTGDKKGHITWPRKSPDIKPSDLLL